MDQTNNRFTVLVAAYMKWEEEQSNSHSQCSFTDDNCELGGQTLMKGVVFVQYSMQTRA